MEVLVWITQLLKKQQLVAGDFSARSGLSSKLHQVSHGLETTWKQMQDHLWITPSRAELPSYIKSFCTVLLILQFVLHLLLTFSPYLQCFSAWPLLPSFPPALGHVGFPFCLLSSRLCKPCSCALPFSPAGKELLHHWLPRSGSSCPALFPPTQWSVCPLHASSDYKPTTVRNGVRSLPKSRV